MKKFLMLLVLAALSGGGVTLQAKYLLLENNTSGMLDSNAKLFVYMWGGTSPATDYDSPTVTEYALITINGVEYRKYDIGDNTGALFRRCNPNDDKWDWGKSANIETFTAEYSIVNPSYVEVTSPTAVSLTQYAAGTIKAYFIGSDWSGVKAFVWQSAGIGSISFTGNFPGDDCTSLGQINGEYVHKWTYDLTAGYYTPINIIFNNGLGGDVNQTVDLSFTNGTIYQKTTSGGGKYSVNEISSITLADGTNPFVLTEALAGLTVSYDRSFTVDQKYTICLPFALTAAEVSAAGKFYKLTGFDSSTLRFTEVNETEAYVPYYFVPSTTTPFSGLTGKTLAATPATIETVVDTDVKFVGTMSQVTDVKTAAGDGKTVFGFSGGDFVKVTGTSVNVKPFRAYIVVPDSKVPASGAKMAVSFGDETGIAAMVENVNDNNYYDLQGRRVQNPTKGLYIVNGKKVIR